MSPAAPDSNGSDPLAAPARPGIGERLSQLIRHATVSAELAERGPEPFEALVASLAELYPLVHERLELERVTDFGLLFRWPGASDAKPLVLMAHYDVVPVDESDDWRFPPFEGRIADGIVYGRGALDDKGPLVVVLDAVENLLAAGHEPAQDVYLSFGGNEEVYGLAAVAISDLLHERGIRPWLIVDEGGAVVDAPLPFVTATAAMVGVGEKGIATLRLSARGDGGHASAPPTITAVGRVARAVDRLTPGTFPARTPRAVTVMLQRFAPHARGLGGVALKVLAGWPWLTARVFARLGGEPAALVRTTVAPTMLDGGTAANVLPSQAGAIVNLRIAPGETVDGTAARVRRRIRDPKVDVVVVEGSDPSPQSATDNAQFGLIEAAVGASYPGTVTAPYLMMAASDARFFHRYSGSVYRFAPLSMSSAQRASVHGVDERVTVDSLERGERFHRALIVSLPR
ncbi:M20/M25/M40 family metallo-hydrolase [Agromyces seonyuensis]|uniref:M20/M25/M40 family metallo-hydrolase n=1 Tax=Agromyces seonyuensis TaxID=2662446 RepID=A0A6I4P2N5_9MICO|nr:M20/M25/M40 family metallo-hydrolase [Agromyces seonyuensis]MWB97474.1 M20/M25/M40 family metallo-hydrolase [Agromyces seonyuensis]